MGKLLLVVLGIVNLIQVICCSDPPNCDGTDFAPVCGNNGIIFYNSYSLGIYNNNYSKVGVVEQVEMHQCRSRSCPCTGPCTLEFNPVWAYDSHKRTTSTYGNLCQFECEAKCERGLSFCGPSLNQLTE